MAKMDRDAYYMEIASVAAKRGTCDRRQVGAVIVFNDRILSTGFNGAPRGMPECDEVGHEMIHGHCVRTIHAEANALLEVGAATLRACHAAQQSSGMLPLIRKGLGLVTLYTTTSPCPACMNLILNGYIQRVVYGVRYAAPEHEGDRSQYALDAAKRMAITMDFHGTDG